METSTVQRLLYRAQCLDKNIAGKFFQNRSGDLLQSIAEDRLMTASVFADKNQLYLYYECIGDSFRPEQVFPGCEKLLVPWTGAEKTRYWVPMADIFHYNRPVSAGQWKRRRAVERRLGRLAALKPEMIQSYIFHHTLHQEERPGQGDKYGIIGIHENLLFFYLEEPCVVETCPFPAKPESGLCPKNWAEAM